MTALCHRKPEVGSRVLHACRPSRPQEGVVTRDLGGGSLCIRLDDGSLLISMVCCRVEVIS